MKFNCLLILLFLLVTLNINSQENKVISPDGKLSVTIFTENGKISYNVVYNGKTFLEKSPLGLKTNVGDFSQGLAIEANPLMASIDENYELSNIKQRNVHYQANEAIYSFTREGKKAIDVVFRVSNNDVAFKYIIHPQGERMSCMVEEETSGFVFPVGTTTFLCPQSKPMVGFARSMPSYETPYTVDAPMGQNGNGQGYTFPCLFKSGINGWLLISETGVSSSYCGSRLTGHADGLYTIDFPQEGENNGNGTASPGIPLPGETPWRTITLGETLAPIVETTVPFDLVKPLYQASKDYKYGRGSWSWIIGMDESTKYEEQMRYIDFSAAMGYESLLVDALWDTQIGREKIAELAKYAAGKDVGLFLWYNSNGYWNDAPQTPKGIMDNTIARRKEMKWMQSIGIRGIKVDFFGGDKQVTMKLYEDILFDANDFGLLVIFHGCTLPRGWERMYPNFAASEAVLASENLHFAQVNCDMEAFNACCIQFIRNTVGSMDFGGSTLNKYYNSKNSAEMWGGRRVTSDVFALSTAVLFQSAMQHFAMAPNNLTDAPVWAINFMKEVPTTWEETRFIDGYPGKFIVLARRHGAKWYISAVNAGKETLKIKIFLPMLAAGDMLNLYRDNEQLHGELTSVELGKQELELSIPCNGGALIVK
ncbi:MAG: glycoside hydrolase family 97 protein [Bacteroidales bacterium]|nr:glycoside hydrolase family 97 protein [Bacteroidales bacterium]